MPLTGRPCRRHCGHSDPLPCDGELLAPWPVHGDLEGKAVPAPDEASCGVGVGAHPRRPLVSAGRRPACTQQPGQLGDVRFPRPAGGVRGFPQAGPARRSRNWPLPPAAASRRRRDLAGGVPLAGAECPVGGARELVSVPGDEPTQLLDQGPHNAQAAPQAWVCRQHARYYCP